MFSSTNSGISLPQFSPCFSLTASLGGCLDDETLLHYDNYDLLSHCLLESSTEKTMSLAKTTSTSPEVNRSNGDRSRPLHTHRRWQSGKKDRHSKIFTAQGPRDRRVRLSMDIARKFFDLQDLLGFDKASKTLDWLLTKSKTAIKEIIQMKHIDGPSAQRLCSFSECKDLDLKKTTASKKKQKRNRAEHKDAKALQMAAVDAVAKESRAKARARARERTKEKNSLRKLTEDKELPYLNSSIANQAIGSCKTSDSIICQKRISSVSINTGMNGFFCFNPDLIISTESSSNFSQWPPNATENWDISSTMISSSLCALTNMELIQSVCSTSNQQEAL